MNRSLDLANDISFLKIKIENKEYFLKERSLGGGSYYSSEYNHFEIKKSMFSLLSSNIQIDNHFKKLGLKYFIKKPYHENELNYEIVLEIYNSK